MTRLLLALGALVVATAAAHWPPPPVSGTADRVVVDTGTPIEIRP